MIGDDRRVDASGAALAAARERDGSGYFVGTLELYCEADGCAVRTVTVVLKELDGPTTRPRFSCPACRRVLKIHHAWTAEEVNAAEKLEARCSVNMQLYVARELQRLGDPQGLVAIPIGVVLDDRLPGFDAT